MIDILLFVLLCLNSHLAQAFVNKMIFWQVRWIGSQHLQGRRNRKKIWDWQRWHCIWRYWMCLHSCIHFFLLSFFLSFFFLSFFLLIIFLCVLFCAGFMFPPFLIHMCYMELCTGAWWSVCPSIPHDENINVKHYVQTFSPNFIIPVMLWVPLAPVIQCNCQWLELWLRVRRSPMSKTCRVHFSVSIDLYEILCGVWVILSKYSNVA